MDFYHIKSKRPNCKTCGKPLKEWNPFATEHEHTECITNRITDVLIEHIKTYFK